MTTSIFSWKIRKKLENDVNGIQNLLYKILGLKTQKQIVYLWLVKIKLVPHLILKTAFICWKSSNIATLGTKSETNVVRTP